MCIIISFKLNCACFICLGEEEPYHVQLPVAKKYEMLGDCDATKLKLGLKGVTNKTAISTLSGKNFKNYAEKGQNGKKYEDAKSFKKKQGNGANKEEEMETLNNVNLATEDSINKNSATELIEEEYSNNSESTKNVYDPNVAIGKKIDKSIINIQFILA